MIEFIVASLTLLLLYAWLMILCIGAWALAIYIVCAVYEFCCMLREEGIKQVVKHPLSALKHVHQAGTSMFRDLRLRAL
jgi:hypothetical protein